MAKYKVGDKVKVDGRPGVVTEVAAHDAHWLEHNPQMYGVRLTDRAKKDDGSLADHQYDTLGCVLESQLTGD